MVVALGMLNLEFTLEQVEADTAHNYGGAFDAYGSGTGDMIGVSGYAGGTNSAHNIGVEGNAIANTSGINYGAFGRAQDGGTNWAGYFASGNVKIENLGVITEVTEIKLLAEFLVQSKQFLTE